MPWPISQEAIHSADIGTALALVKTVGIECLLGALRSGPINPTKMQTDLDEALVSDPFDDLSAPPGLSDFVRKRSDDRTDTDS